MDIGCVRWAALITTACRSAGRVLLRERQRHHAAVRRPDAAVQAVDAELVEQPDDHVALVECAHGRKGLAGRRARRVVAAAEEVDAEDPVAVRVERTARADALLPPTGPLAGKPEHVPARRDATEDGDDRRAAPPGESIGDAHVVQAAAEVQREGAGQANDSRRHS